MKDNRIVGTLAKRFKTVVDVKSIPAGMSPAQWVKLADNGFIFYDSENGHRPKLYEIGNVREDVEVTPVFVAADGKEVSLEEVQKSWEDTNFWDKELYKCKQSPIQYFVNYYSTNPKPTQKEIDEYLGTLGLAATADSGDVMKEEAKQARLKFSESITLEHLKDLKPVRDAIVAEYNVVTDKYKAEAQEVFDTLNEKLLSDKVITAIMKTPARKAVMPLKEYVDERKSTWDKQMLRAIDFDVLIRLWKTI